MKRKICLLSIFILSLGLIGCTFSERDNKPNDNGNNGESQKISDYYPVKANTRYVYLGEGNEFASYDVYTDYTFENKVQYRKDNGGTVLAEVYEIGNNSIERVYSRGEAYYREDYLRNESLRRDKSSEVILKGPVKVGTKWNLEDGSERSITGLDVQVSVPAGDFKALEVTTVRDDTETKDYYAKGVGLVKSVFKAGTDEISSSLERVEENASLTQEISFYYPNLDEDKYYSLPTSVEFKTNDITRKLLENTYKSPRVDLSQYGLGNVFSENTKINYLYLGKNDMVYLDLNQAFLDELNAGAYYESMILQSITNTFGQYYGVEQVKITIDGKNYESGHISQSDKDYNVVNFDSVEIIE